MDEITSESPLEYFQESVRRVLEPNYRVYYQCKSGCWYQLSLAFYTIEEARKEKRKREENPDWKGYRIEILKETKEFVK